jgi:hypothetical protein
MGLSLRERRALLVDWADSSNALSTDPLNRRDAQTGIVASVDEIREALGMIEEEIARRAPPIERLLATGERRRPAPGPRPARRASASSAPKATTRPLSQLH